MNSRNTVKVIAVALSLLLASSALSSVAIAQNADTTNRGEMKKLMNEADRLHDKAKKLLVRAEEQGNHDAVAELEIVVKLTVEAKVLIEAGELEQVKVLLEEAEDHLVKAERLLKGTVKKIKDVKDEVEDDINSLLRIVEKLHDTAKRVIAIAEEQGNVEAKVEAEICIKLALEAKVLIEEGNYDDARAKLKEAADHLSKAMRMLQLTETTDPERPKRLERPFVSERPDVVVDDIFGFEFEIHGSGYAVLKNQNTLGILYETEISMHGIVVEERERGIHFVLDDVVITAQPYGPSIMVDGRIITLTSIEEWDGKARHRMLFVTGGQMEDDEGNRYKVLLRCRLIDVSEQGLVYKIDGRVYPTDSTDNGRHHVFASLHYLAIAQAVA